MPALFLPHQRGTALSFSRRLFFWFSCLWLILSWNCELRAQLKLPELQSFLQANCLDCHSGKTAEAGFDLKKLGTDLKDKNAEKQWVRIYDRVQSGEMPPADAPQPKPAARQAFLDATGREIAAFQKERTAKLGRVHTRRLTRVEIERSLHALLGIDIPLADQLPEESRAAGFTTVADGQALSHFQLERQLAVVDLALDEAFRRALAVEEDRYEKVYQPAQIVRTDPKRRCREPEMIDGEAVVWSSGLIYYGRLPVTTAPESGWYQFQVTASGLKLPTTGGVWATVRTGLCVSTAPLLAHVTSFEAQEKPRTIEFTAWLPKGHMLEIRPGDNTLKKANFAGGQVGVGEGGPQNVPGIALQKITMKRVHRDADNQQVRRLLFGDLQLAPNKRSKTQQLVSANHEADAARLLKAFATRAFRYPVTDAQLAPYLRVVNTALDQDQDLLSALRFGYRAILSSPRFLYLTETPGKLNDHALAARLSYFLTGAPPDAELAELADAGKLSDPQTLRQQTERLLAGQGGRQFMVDFAAQWLELDQIDFTTPDSKLFPEFDSIVQQSMLDETHATLEAMLRENQSVKNLIDSNSTFLNSRLARFYDIANVTGDELRRVELLPSDHRGGVLTQGAILKVSANGSNTSPVIRGVWVSERLLGVPIPPPPSNVPAIEPDIRGATTIREQLAKHRSQDSCAVCHVKIDPPGFSLENFDPAGQWRTKYTQLINGKKTTGAVVDASYQLADGRKFQNIQEFQKLILERPHPLAANVAEKLLVYGTGAPISFADRAEVEKIVANAARDEYGLRTLVHAVVASPIFQNK